MTDLEKQALRAAYPFGGHALASQRPVLGSLEAKGMVEVTCTDMDGAGYVLTPTGKAHLKTLNA